MQSALQCAPKKCTHCKQKLEKPHYGFPWVSESFKKFGMKTCSIHAPLKFQVWFIKCKCGIVYVWSYYETANGCWKIRSDMPLFDSRQIVTVAK